MLVWGRRGGHGGGALACDARWGCPVIMRKLWMPPIASIRSVEAVVRLRSVTAAARELRVSQPAVTQALARLSEEFGSPLFLDGEGEPRATETALALSGLYRSFKDQFDTIRARAEARNSGGIVIKMSMDLSRVLSGYLLPRAAAAFRIEKIFCSDEVEVLERNHVLIVRHRRDAQPSGVVESRRELVQLVSFRGRVRLDEISFADSIYVPRQWLEDWRAFNKSMNDEVDARIVVVDDPAMGCALAAMGPAFCLLDARFASLLLPYKKHHFVSQAEFSTDWNFSVVAGRDFDPDEVRSVFCEWLEG